MYESTSRRAAGHVICTDPSGVKEADTHQCVHCGEHWVVKKGSGTIRGFCVKCDGYTCGAERCHECFPFEERMDLNEKGLLPNLMGPRSSIKALHERKLILPGEEDGPHDRKIIL